MLDNITDGPRHPDEDAEYFDGYSECPGCKEISLRCVGTDRGLLEYECAECGHYETYWASEPPDREPSEGLQGID